MRPTVDVQSEARWTGTSRLEAPLGALSLASQIGRTRTTWTEDTKLPREHYGMKRTTVPRRMEQQAQCYTVYSVRVGRVDMNQVPLTVHMAVMTRKARHATIQTRFPLASSACTKLQYDTGLVSTSLISGLPDANTIEVVVAINLASPRGRQRWASPASL